MLSRDERMRRDMSITPEKKLRLSFHGRIIDSLGIQMYQSPVAAVAELIANAWDADATAVAVSLPSDTGPDAEIVVKDNGKGMTFTDCQDRYLNVGLNRRVNDGDRTAGGRSVLGRKGIGKFAGFGIARVVQIETVSSETGERTVFSLDLRKLRSDEFVSESKEIDLLEADGPDDGIGEEQYGGVWDALRQQLEKLGYVTGSRVVCTSRFGIPQYRKRSILAAARRELVRPERFADLLERELLIPEGNPNAALVSVAEAIGHLPPIADGETHWEIPNHKTRALIEINYKRLSSAKPGESNAYMKDTEYGDLTLPCHRRVNRKFRTPCFNDVYTRMRPDFPSPTITTKCHSISNGRFGHYDVTQVRGISLREAAILQSFPEDYVFYLDDQIEPIARMIGNAVPPKLAEFFAGYLVNSLSQPDRPDRRMASS
jgi:site-specific DNA-cytosine methylase